MMGFNQQAQDGKRRGFTLLEVLIALAILAISSLAILGQAGQSLSQLQQLQLQTHANAVAENQMSALQIMPDWPSLGMSSQLVTLADQQWQVNTDVTTTSEPWLRKIEITVTYGDQNEAVLTRLIGYRGLH